MQKLENEINAFSVSDGRVLSLNSIVDMLREKKKENTPLRLHPLGFLQISLCEGGADRLIPGPRIHIWPETAIRSGLEKGSVYEIHTHVYDLTSWVLHGEITDHVYEITPNPKGKFYRSDGVCSPNEYRREKKGRVDCKEISATTYKKGQQYNVPKGTIHSSNNNNVFTITLVDRYNFGETTHPILIGPIDDNEFVFNETKYDEKYAWKLVDQTINYISNKKHF